MNISTLRVLGLLMLILGAVACKSTKPVAEQAPKPSPALLTFANGSIVNQAEFERVYAKNNGGLEEAANHSVDQFQEYLDLYINFKRKVFEAEEMGLAETPAFKQEFGTYRKQLAQPYMSAKEVEDRLIREAYDRSQYQVNASHILITVQENAAPADTLAAYQKVMNLRDSLLNHGADFATFAKKYSNDPSAQQNDGNLGFFSVFTMVYPFESGAYETEVGSISMPVRTRFGYHLIKVNERVENQGTKRSSHLIVRVGDRYSAKTDAEAEEKINELYQQLQQSADFAELAKQYSDDPSTANRGGDLGTGRLLPEMEAAKRELGEGEFSEPFQTGFGWHIMAVTEVDTVEDFESAKADLKQKISRDSRSQLSQAALINRIKEENNYQLDQAVLDQFINTLEGSFAQGRWKADTNYQSLYEQPLFTIGTDFQATVNDMMDYYKSQRLSYPGQSPTQGVQALLKRFSEEKLLEYEEDRLPEKNPDFKNLLQEYRDGILLFTLMEQKVWKKAVEDTVGLKTYYEEHPEEFEANTLVEVREYRASDQAVISQVEAYLKQGKSAEEIDSLVNQESSLAVRITGQTYEAGKSDVEETLFEQPAGYVTSVMEEGSFFRILVSEKVLPPGIKPFDKAKSEAITKYQDYLEAEWLDELSEKYPVEINEQAFEQLFK
ncbi:MAG: peptidylprolyl isomerase [Bacteroidota bacterium]